MTEEEDLQEQIENQSPNNFERTNSNSNAKVNFTKINKDFLKSLNPFKNQGET